MRHFVFYVDKNNVEAVFPLLVLHASKFMMSEFRDSWEVTVPAHNGDKKSIWDGVAKRPAKLISGNIEFSGG